MWNPSVICDGIPAHERATWLVQNKGMSQQAAQQQVMQEFPSQFGGAMGMGMGMGGTAPGWNPNALCDGSLASERAQWLVSNEGMNLFAAQQKVMSQFPSQFGGMGMGAPGMAVAAPMVVTPGVAVATPMVVTPGVAVAGMCQQQPCFKCQGKGFSHDSSMTHDKLPTERCFFCKNCSGCGGTGIISGGGGGMGMGMATGMGAMGGMGTPVQPCFKCQGKGFCHDSSMTHDKAPQDRCFFCSNCNSCGGTGRIGGGGMGGMGTPMGVGYAPGYQGNISDDCRNCTIL